MNGDLGYLSNIPLQQATSTISPNWCYMSPPPAPHFPREYELFIEKLGSEILLNYGAKLRVLMADPEKGKELREAVQKVNEALEKI
jgi:hypothetical protein